MTRLRLPLAFLLALLFTGALFFVLQMMISATVEIGETKQATKIEFSRLRRDTDVAERRREKAARDKPPPALTTPQMSRMSFQASADAVQMLTPQVDAKASLSRIAVSLGGSDRDVIPLVRIEPDYPSRALNRGIEGWVLVQFTITPQGTVKDAKVIDAEPKGYFEDAALKAIARWKYNPKVEGGVAIERRGNQVVLTFKVEGG